MGDVGDEKWVVDWRAVKSPPAWQCAEAEGRLGFGFIRSALRRQRLLLRR